MDKCIQATGRTCPEPMGYRIRSNGKIHGVLWPAPGACEFDVHHRCVAMSIAAKSRTEPGASIQVLHLASGQVIYEKPPEPALRVREPAGQAAAT